MKHPQICGCVYDDVKDEIKACFDHAAKPSQLGSSMARYSNTETSEEKTPTLHPEGSTTSAGE